MTQEPITQSPEAPEAPEAPVLSPLSPAQVEELESGIGCDAIFEGLIFLLGAFLMASKTQDLMAAFSPESFFGFQEIAGYYGLGCTLLVEGLLIFEKFKMLFMGRAKNRIEWGWGIILTIVPFVISFLAQSIDSILIAQTLSEQPAEVQLAVTWGVPGIPGIIIFLLAIRSFINSAPLGTFRGDTGKGSGSRARSGGIDLLGWLRALDPRDWRRSSPALGPTRASTD